MITPRVAIRGTNCSARHALMWVIGETGMGKSGVAKERVGIRRLKVQVLVQLVGKQTYALYLHTQKMPVSKDRHPMRS